MKNIYALIFLLCLSTSASAGVFSASFTVGGETKTEEYSSATDLFTNFDLEDIVVLFPTYNGTQNVNITVDFRGVPLVLTSSTNSTAVNFSIADLGFSKSFSGTTRDDSLDLLDDYLEEEGEELLNDLMARLAEVSPHDPIAGNPASLMANLVSNDFERSVQKSDPAPSEGGTNTNVIGIGVSARAFDQDGKSAKVFTLPITYIVKIDSDPRKRIIYSFPLNYYEVDEAVAYSIPAGVTYRFPMNDNWYLAPSLGIGVTASPDLGSGGLLTSVALTSTYSKKAELFRWGVGNMYGNYKTQDLKVGDITANPNIQNQVMRNGVFLSKPHKFFGKEAESEVFLYDTRYFGDKLYIDQYNEVGLSIGANRDTKGVKRLIRFGASYLWAEKSTGFGINFGYKF